MTFRYFKKCSKLIQMDLDSLHNTIKNEMRDESLNKKVSNQSVTRMIKIPVLYKKIFCHASVILLIKVEKVKWNK